MSNIFEDKYPEEVEFSPELTKDKLVERLEAVGGIERSGVMPVKEFKRLTSHSFKDQIYGYPTSNSSANRNIIITVDTLHKIPEGTTHITWYLLKH